ncbi:MAG: SoxS protein [Rhodospirillaceae bacterium]|nr:SoxS protein [Rhodospirillaceae bacterium]
MRKQKFSLILIQAIALYATPAHALELIMFETKGCIWCKKWREEVGLIYERTEEGKIAPLRSIDMTVNTQTQFKLRAPVTISPTFVMVLGENEVGRITGYPGEDFFWALLSKLLDKAKLFETNRQSTLIK